MGGQGGCERRIEVFVKIQKKNGGGVGGGEGGEGSGWGGQGGCDRRIEVYWKIQKKIGEGGGGGVGSVGGRFGVCWGEGGQDGCENEELKFL